MTPDWERECEVLLAHLGGRDRGAAMAQVEALLDASVPARDVVTRLLTVTQRQVGTRWEAGEWSIAQEHMATGITEDILQMLSFRAPAPGDRGHVAVACVEGEYHAMPARMLAEVLRGLGYNVTFLGASLPSESLSGILVEAQPAALALSCSLTANLLEAARSIDVAHGHGIPVIVGGSAFGNDARRAVALGADAWAGDPQEAVSALDSWVAARPPTLGTSSAFGDHLDIHSARLTLVDEAMAVAVRGAGAADPADPRRLSRLRAMITGVLDNLSAGLKVDDLTVLEDFLTWSRREGDPTVALAAVAEVLPASLGRAQRVLAESRSAAWASTAA